MEERGNFLKKHKKEKKKQESKSKIKR